jgi:uncharacterized protein YihD (DUF1040 family)
MPRRSNKWIAEILTPPISSSPSADTTINVHTSSQSSMRNDNIHDSELDRKIVIATEGFTTRKFCELVLRDRSRLSKENALTICDYVIAMKREINPRLSYRKNTIQVLSDLSRAVGIEKKFIDMTRDDILLYLDKHRKSENEDLLHRWIGTYNLGVVIVCRFFKWLYYPDIEDPKEGMKYQHLRESLIVLLVLNSSRERRLAATNLPTCGLRKMT